MKKLSIKKKAAIAATAMLCAVLLLTIIYGSIAFVSLEINPLRWSVANRQLMVFIGCMALFIVVWVAFYTGWYDD